MQWPPASWEREATHWRPDVGTRDDEIPFDAPDRGGFPQERSERRSGPDYGALAREFAETALLVVVIVFGIRLVVQNFKIEGQSMEPTLHSSQYVLVNKLAYFGFGEPRRGDVVVFHAWERAGEKDFIKRIIGLPGDTIEIRDDEVLVNGLPLDEPYLAGRDLRGSYGPLTLADDEYFVLGDNRPNSSDSRNYGALPGDRLVGKAWFTYWPPGQIMLVPDGDASYADSR